MRRWKMILAAVTAGLMLAQPVYGAESQIVKSEWQDEHLGPGVARWVDESGNVSEETGVRPDLAAEEPQVPEGPAADILAAEAASQSGDGQASVENGQASGDAGQADGSEAGAAAGGETSGETAAGAGEEQASGRVIDPAKPMVALTFDDGPYAPVGNRILDCLAQYNGKATFYVVGNRVPSYTAEMQRIAAEGHEIGNHTYSHKYLNTLNAAQIRQEIDRCADTVQAVCGVRPATVRLPGGNKNATVLAAVQEPIVLWNVDTLDWKTRNAQNTVNVVLSQVQDGDIILMHELYQASGDAALTIIPELTNRGYQLVTVSEMAQYRRGGLQNGQVYYNMR